MTLKNSMTIGNFGQTTKKSNSPALNRSSEVASKAVTGVKEEMQQSKMLEEARLALDPDEPGLTEAMFKKKYGKLPSEVLEGEADAPEKPNAKSMQISEYG